MYSSCSEKVKKKIILVILESIRQEVFLFTDMYVGKQAWCKLSMNKFNYLGLVCFTHSLQAIYDVFGKCPRNGRAVVAGPAHSFKWHTTE